MTYLFPVDLDTGIGHGSVEFKGKHLSGCIRNLECGSVIPLADIRQSAGAAGLPGCRFLAILLHCHLLKVVGPVKRPVNRPVVRHAHTLPVRHVT